MYSQTALGEVDDTAVALQICAELYAIDQETLANEVVLAIDSPIDANFKVVWLHSAMETVGMMDREKVIGLISIIDDKVKDKKELESVKAHVMGYIANRILTNSALAVDILGGILGIHVDVNLSYGGIIAKPERSRLH